jgi:chloride channel 3/4/5
MPCQVKDSYRRRLIHNDVRSIREKLLAAFDSCSGWIAVSIMGTCTAIVAFIVDICQATVTDWKSGYCKRNPFVDREGCCKHRTPLVGTMDIGECTEFQEWSDDFWRSFGIYLAFALLYGIIASSATMFTRKSLPVAESSKEPKDQGAESQPVVSGKSMYMAAGSGIPEIKTILSGFVIPGFLSFKVLFVKAFGAVFAVSTGMTLGKEGPFVHVSACVGNLVANLFPKYRDNGRKYREILSAAVAAGLSVAFGAPIGGVLFSYEEISTYFPRKTLWRAFLCSLFAAMVLRELNPTGTGKLALFETNYGTSYKFYHYLIFIFLGIAGGIWGGLFCNLNYRWSKWFRSYSIIKNHPVFEVFLVVLITVLLQFPNPLTREPGDAIIRNLLVNCHNGEGKAGKSWVCQNELTHDTTSRRNYVGYLAGGCLTKLVLTIVTFGAKVPSGIIIPALDAGALFGRLVGQVVTDISPGIFAMVGAAAFLAGVSRMTISLCVIMFELTGELEYVVPHMIAILVAKWTADALGKESVYDLAQNVLGHPFLDLDHTMASVQAQSPPHLVSKLVPPKQTMDEITVVVDTDNKVPRALLQKKLDRLQDRGMLDAGVVLVQDGMLQGYLGQKELEFGLKEVGKLYPVDVRVRLLGDHTESGDGAGRYGDEEEMEIRVTSAAEAAYGDAGRDVKASGDLDLVSFVDRTPLTMSENSPIEYALEAFAKLGLKYLIITEEGTGRMKGVCLKKRLIQYIEGLHEEH